MEVRKEDQRDPDEKVVEIEIERLRDFKNHPFKVQADSQMKELQESIKVFGSEIPMSVRAAEVSVEGKSIYSYDPKGKVACAYKGLTKEVLKEA